jgi:hypothetical protein
MAHNDEARGSRAWSDMNTNQRSAATNLLFRQYHLGSNRTLPMTPLPQLTSQGALTEQEQRRLAELEAAIDRSFIEIGDALREIRDSGLPEHWV